MSGCGLQIVLFGNARSLLREGGGFLEFPVNEGVLGLLAQALVFFGFAAEPLDFFFSRDGVALDFSDLEQSAVMDGSVEPPGHCLGLIEPAEPLVRRS